MPTNNSILILDRIGEKISDLKNIELQEVIKKAGFANPYFTETNCRKAIKDIAENYLSKNKLEKWLSHYTKVPNKSPKTIGIIAAGNIPLVAIHDVICCLVTGHKVKIKLSSKDEVLMKYFFQLVNEEDENLGNNIEVVEKLEGFDAVIATGSDNTARYFDYYFKKYPHIIRSNRVSIAVLSGYETEKQLEKLCEDIFSYFGLGCRNVSQLLVPENYDFRPLINTIHQNWSDLTNHHLYKNNLDYYRTIYLMNKVEILDCDLVNMVENESPFSPISCLHFYKYTDMDFVKLHISLYKDKIQCIIAHSDLEIPDAFGFGQAQCPALSDYADDVDTMEFLMNL